MVADDDRLTVDEVVEIVAAIIAQHVERLHTLSEPDVAQLVKEHVDMRRAVELITIELHGKEAPTVADPDKREGGIVEQVDDIHEIITNGGVTLKLTRGAKAALATTIGVILTALIAGIFDLIGAP